MAHFATAHFNAYLKGDATMFDYLNVRRDKSTVPEGAAAAREQQRRDHCPVSPTVPTLA